MRIGLGYDVHAFVTGRPLILGGVELPHEFGLAGHSDADVVTHALMDAVLGAMRAGDIGAHFPDTDPRYAGISSLVLLEHVADLMRSESWSFVDADIVVVLERPMISPYRAEMRARLSSALDVPLESMGLKATTTEGLGFAGRGEGVAAHAVVLLERT